MPSFGSQFWRLEEIIICSMKDGIMFVKIEMTYTQKKCYGKINFCNAPTDVTSTWNFEGVSEINLLNELSEPFFKINK